MGKKKVMKPCIVFVKTTEVESGTWLDDFYLALREDGRCIVKEVVLEDLNEGWLKKNKPRALIVNAYTVGTHPNSAIWFKIREFLKSVRISNNLIAKKSHISPPIEDPWDITTIGFTFNSSISREVCGRPMSAGGKQDPKSIKKFASNVIFYALSDILY